MKTLIIILGILVMLSWGYLFYVFKKKGYGQQSIRIQNINLLSCLLTLLMTILASIYVE